MRRRIRKKQSKISYYTCCFIPPIYTPGVSCLDVQVLVMIADEVLGGWSLLKEWRQELVPAKVSWMVSVDHLYKSALREVEKGRN